MKNDKQFIDETEKIVEDLFLKMNGAGANLRSYFEVELKLLKHIIECEKKDHDA